MSLSCRRILSGIVITYAAAFLLLCNFAPAQAQDDHHPQRGFNPGNSYAFSDIETISMSSGNLMLNVPLGSLPAGRGGSPGFRLSLTYNSKLYDTHIEEVINETGDKENLTYLNRSQDGGWRYTLPAGYTTRLVKRGNEEPLPGCTTATGAFNYQKNAYIYKMQLIYPDGSTHEFRPTGYSDYLNDGYFNISPNGWISTVTFTAGSNNSNCTYNESQATTGPMVYYSTDGSYTRLVIEHSESGPNSGSGNGWTLYFPDGGRVVGASETTPQRMYDRNNNYVDLLSITYNNHPAKKIVDQLGRYIIIETDQANNQDYVYMQGVGGQEVRSTVRWKTNYVRKVYVASSNGEHRGNFYNAPLHSVSRVVDQIILPAQAGGLNYTFGYNGTDQDLSTISPGWGELSSATLPSGVKATYAYALDGVSASGSNAIFPTWKNVQNNKPKLKQLTYRQEYDLSSPVSNSPCDSQSEACTTEEWVYGLGGVLPIILTLDPWITRLKGPDGGVLEEYVGDEPNSPSFKRALKTIRPDGTMSEHTWAQNRSAGMTGQAINPYLKTEFTSIKDAAGNYVLTAIKDYSYDKNGNVTEVREYDWVSYGSVSRDASGAPTGIPSNAPLKRVTSNKYNNPTPDASDTTTISPYAYHQASAKQLLNAIASSEVSDGSQVFLRAEFSYDDYNTTGNLTEQRSWDSTKGGITRPLILDNSVAVTNQYDLQVPGKITQTTDARGTHTEYIYGSINGFADLYPTETRVAVGTAVQRTTQQEYDFWTGLVKRATDVDNNVSTSTTYDDLGRPTLVRAAENKPEETRARTEYNDTLRRVIVRSDLTNVGDEKLVAIQHYDQLSRIRLTRQLEDVATQGASDETQGIKVQTRYKYSGVNSYQVSSQPYREASSSQATAAMGWSRAKADNGGRLMEMQQFGGSSLPAPWSSNTTGTGQVVSTYDANTTTVMDQAGKVRRSVTDGLGRLIRVDEPDQNNNLDVNGVPFQSTSYSYDALDNLTTVTQGTQTPRSFVYDSLKRLTSATNPESGTISYQYDNNGNLTEKTDARGVVSAYAYDALNRNTGVTYTNDPAGTPSVTRTYDGATNGKGRLWKTETSAANGSPTTINGYDAMGRPLSESQQFYSGSAWSQTYTVQRNYNLAGGVTSQTYPSNHTVTYNYDAAGRLGDKDAQNLAFTGNLGSGGAPQTYSRGITYTPFGAMAQEQFGTDTALYNKLAYNPRGQLVEIRESTAPNDSSWDRGKFVNWYSLQCGGATCNATDNNGNLRKQETLVPNNDQNTSSTSWYQQYDYDNLNRLQRIHEYTGTTAIDWQQEYVYDRYGNRTLGTATNQTWGSGINRAFALETATNRLYAPGDLSLAEASRQMQYDQAGNLKRDVYSGAAVSRAYDAENRMTSETQANYYVAGAYTYNADGQRVRRKIDNVETWQVYGLDGELLAEYAANASPASPQKEYGYRGGQLLITAEAPPSTTASSSSNVALATNGGTAVASSTLASFNPGGVNDGSRRANTAPAIWLDNTYQSFPDSIEIDFNGSKTISEIDVVTQQDDYQNPIEPTLAQTFSLYGLTAFDVQYWNGSSWATVPNGNVIGNNKVWRQLSFSSITTSKIKVVVNAVADNVYCRVVEVEAWSAAGQTQNVVWTNAVGVSSSGNSLTKTATTGWGNAGASSTQTLVSGDGYVEVTVAELGRSRIFGFSHTDTNQSWDTIDFGLHCADDANNTIYVYESGTQRGTFGSYASGDKLRVSIVGGVVKYSRNGTVFYTSTVTPNYPLRVDTALYENGATISSAVFSSGATGSTANINWLVTDQLGTPRMIFDKSGLLATTKRHDYLPFGEELSSGVGLRSSGQGYGAADGVRQKFTQKERDIETGLDYFLARYYSSTQGRFTSPDEFKGGPSELWVLGSGDPKKQALVYADVTNPQSLNKYQYTFNNPLRYVDPDGQNPQDPLALDWDVKDLAEGRITQQEFRDRQTARGVGAAIGVTVVAVAIAGKEIGAALLFWMSANPDKVQQVASVLQETAGGPPGMISGVGSASKAEWSIAQKLAGEGKNVDIVAAQGVGRTADFVVNGIKTELKTLQGVSGVATSGTVKNAIGRGLGQSGNVIIDARGVSLTAETAQKGVARAFGADTRLQVVRIIGKDYDFTIARH